MTWRARCVSKAVGGGRTAWLLAALLLGLSAQPGLPVRAQAPAGTQPTPLRQPPTRLSPAQQRQLFPDFRRLVLTDHQERIAILQRSERCSRQAADLGGLRLCQRQQRDQLLAQRQRHGEAMRALMARNGLAMPHGGPGGPGGGPGGRPGGPGGGADGGYGRPEAGAEGVLWR